MRRDVIVLLSLAVNAAPEQVMTTILINVHAHLSFLTISYEKWRKTKKKYKLCEFQPQGHYLLGRVYILINEIDKGIGSLKGALDRNPFHYTTHNDLLTLVCRGQVTMSLYY